MILIPGFSPVVIRKKGSTLEYLDIREDEEESEDQLVMVLIVAMWLGLTQWMVLIEMKSLLLLVRRVHLAGTVRLVVTGSS